MIRQTLAAICALGGSAVAGQDAGAEAAPVVFVELWSAKPAWTALSDEEQSAYLDGVGSSIGGLTEGGVTLEHIAVANPSTDRDAGYDYLAVWTMPDERTARHFEAQVRADGFYDYFEQVNASGTTAPPPAVFGAMIEE